jgi:cytochrome c oxidase subunit II
MKRLGWTFAVPALALAQQSAFHTGGHDARHIGILGAFFVGLLSAIFLIVIALTLITVIRRHRGIEQEPLEASHRPSARTEQRLTTTVSWATGISVVILFALIVASVAVGKTTSAQPNHTDGLVVEVTGNQWWWNIHYPNDDASRIVITANELHIPVGQRVMIRGTSNDVIHSFWAPSLQGKRDLIPGHITSEWIQADREGNFRGQCAEFCGLQHAHMALWVVAESPGQFQTWMERQLQPAVTPTDPQLLRGQYVFLNNACVFCHTISGTPAAGQVGPDLTHFASRRTIAAGTLANNKGNLAGWISDPQNIKPGNHMATVPLKPEDMQPLIDYLESLQ